MRENLSNGSQETFFFLGWEMLVHRLAIGDLEPREVCDYLSRLTWKQRRRHRERQKSNRCRLANQQLCTCITICIHFFAVAARLQRKSAYNFTFCRGSERRQRLYFSFLELWYSLLEFNSRKFANIWRIERVGISTIKYEVPKIHILSDVFVDVAVVLA